MRNISLLIKPSSSSCNLNCNYCFYNQIASERSVESYGIMHLETAENIIKKALEFANGGICNFAFQGGEPTLAGISFFKKFVSLVSKYNVKASIINYCIQTNGVLIDKEWGIFFKQNNFLVGLSLDGDEKINDYNRVDICGNGSFNSIIRGKKILDKNEVPYNILSVIDNNSAIHIKESYNFFKELGVTYLQFIPCLDPLKTENIEKKALDNEHYSKFLKELFDMWYEDYKKGQIISIRFFENILMNIIGMGAESCDMRGECSIQNVIEADGSVYPCDFYVYDKWKIGDINKDNFQEIIFNSISNDFLKESSSSSEKCAQCKWKSICKGGCKRYWYNNEKHIFCEGISEFLDYSIVRFIEIVKKLKY